MFASGAEQSGSYVRVKSVGQCLKLFQILLHDPRHVPLRLVEAQSRRGSDKISRVVTMTNACQVTQLICDTTVNAAGCVKCMPLKRCSGSQSNSRGCFRHQSILSRTVQRDLFRVLDSLEVKFDSSRNKGEEAVRHKKKTLQTSARCPACSPTASGSWHITCRRRTLIFGCVFMSALFQPPSSLAMRHLGTRRPMFDSCQTP